MADDDAEMAKMMAAWDAENKGDGDGSDSSDEGSDDEPLTYDDMLEKFRRDINPGDNEFDHFLLAVSDLDTACDDFEKLTGTRPVIVVSLNGMGTKSARVAFEQACFIEIIGPDPKQGYKHLGGKLKDIPPGEFVPFHYAVRSKDSPERKKTVWKELGLNCDKVTMVAKDRGMPWKWDMYVLEGHDGGGMYPFFCDWKDAHHASGRLPIMGEFGKLTITAPEDSSLHKVLEDIKNVSLETGSYKLEIEFTSSTGTHKFSSERPMGIVFPGR
jgi:hypothetical protein